MKAKLYTRENTSEVRVSKNVYISNEGETKKDFLKRVATLLEADFDEAIDIVEVKIESLQKLEDALLIEAYKASKGGVQEQILKDILIERNIEVEKVVKTARAKIEKVDLEVAKASELYAQSRLNVGKLCSFKPMKAEEGTELSKGIVKTISFNKTNTIMYYNVLCGDKLKCCVVTNPTIEFFEF